MGMNRIWTDSAQGTPRVPRVYGDEPESEEASKSMEQEFPVCMGMNRTMCNYTKEEARVPRVYGDEPGGRQNLLIALCEFPVCMGMNQSVPHAVTPAHVSSPCVWG